MWFLFRIEFFTGVLWFFLCFPLKFVSIDWFSAFNFETSFLFEWFFHCRLNGRFCHFQTDYQSLFSEISCGSVLLILEVAPVSLQSSHFCSIISINPLYFNYLFLQLFFTLKRELLAFLLFSSTIFELLALFLLYIDGLILTLLADSQFPSIYSIYLLIIFQSNFSLYFLMLYLSLAIYLLNFLLMAFLFK